MRYSELLLFAKITTDMREPVNPSQCVSITLRYLATGSTYEDVKVFVLVCLLFGRRMVTEWILSNIVYRLLYILEFE
jgi:hypothetical protein